MTRRDQRSAPQRTEAPDIGVLIDNSSLGGAGARLLGRRSSPAEVADVLSRSGGVGIPPPAQADPDRDKSATDAAMPRTPTGRPLPSTASGSSSPVHQDARPSTRPTEGQPSDLIRSVSRAFQVLEAVGQSPRGLTVKQIARRCELTVATTYHLVRTLAYEGYVMRREDGTYIVGLEVADRYRELVLACRGPQQVQEILRRAAIDTGYTHLLGRFINGRVAIVAIADGARSPYVEDLITGYDDAAHATAVGKALLATLSSDHRWRFVKEQGMAPLTPHTLTSPEALDADLSAGERRGLHVEVNQFRIGLAGAALLVIANREQERRIALACCVPATAMMASAKMIRARLAATAQQLAEILSNQVSA